MRRRLGVDIGGTFTDGVLIDEETGTITIDKVSTTTADRAEGFLTVCRRLASRATLNPEDLTYIIHATTAATNAVIERQGARAGLLVTAGFRDILEIARQVRHELYNLQTSKPLPLIPRRLCFEIAERLDHQGKVLMPLDEDAVARAAHAMHDRGVESIAICFLHSYQNPVHEQAAANIVRRILPHAHLSVSSDIAPEIREYWRASTAVVNAYIAPMVRTYLEAVEANLRRMRTTAGLHLMQSNGGIMSVSIAKERPVYLVESGPAAGVAAATYFASLMEHENAISFDMGGTTAKMGLIRDGQPKVLSEFEVGSSTGSGTSLTKGSGYPILGAVLDLVEVGAGGGSIAWVDSGGVLRVGPHSAGADPGPACYGKGGERPTITDANLVLGRLNAEYFLGGEISLSLEGAQRAIAVHCAEPLGMDLTRAAMGIVDIANATMIQAMRLVSVQRGYDPREFTMVAFGGAGPLHANRLAEELSIPVIVVPPSPGVASALGMLVSDIRHDYRITRLQPLLNAQVDEINAIYRDFEATARTTLLEEGVDAGDIALERYLDMRYQGQSWQLRIPVSDAVVTAPQLTSLRTAFDRLHEQTYGYAVADEPVEIVNVVLSSKGRIPKPQLKEVASGPQSAATAQKGVRDVFFAETGGFIETPLYNRYALQDGNVVEGPAIIEEVDSTLVVHPGAKAHVSRFGILRLQCAAH
jgi:N-methylhydantoinase A